jgi:hypothetical protein
VVHVHYIGPVGHKTAVVDKNAISIDRGQPMAGSEREDEFAML